MFYLKRPIGIVHLIRFILIVILIILIELKYSSCSAQSLNDYLGFSHLSIFFFYVIIWICFSFEIYFFLNRFFGHSKFIGRRSTIILYILLLISFGLASSLTLISWFNTSDGHLITQDDQRPTASKKFTRNKNL